MPILYEAVRRDFPEIRGVVVDRALDFLRSEWTGGDLAGLVESALDPAGVPQ
ncbi:MAG TPA: hypothetical protein VGI39_18055 [Polyangiaceae bacterium]